MESNALVNTGVTWGFGRVIRANRGPVEPARTFYPRDAERRAGFVDDDGLSVPAKPVVSGEQPETPLTDDVLVERSLGGDQEAFRQLYERYRIPVYATVARILHDRIDAQDASQEVFIKVYRALSTWNPGRARFSTWIYRLAANHAIDCWRARHRRAEIGLAEAEGAVEAKAQEGGEFSAGVRPADSVLEDQERVAGIQSCLRQMSARQKKIFFLRHVQGLKLREISAKEGHSLGTVKGSLHRAIRILRQRLRMPEGCGRKRPALLTGTASGN